MSAESDGLARDGSPRSVEASSDAAPGKDVLEEHAMERDGAERRHVMKGDAVESIPERVPELDTRNSDSVKGTFDRIAAKHAKALMLEKHRMTEALEHVMVGGHMTEWDLVEHAMDLALVENILGRDLVRCITGWALEGHTMERASVRYITESDLEKHTIKRAWVR